MKKKSYKIIAVFLAINILGQAVAPTAAFALTGGPSQPEVESFEPAGTTQMVDLFTGDFNYNIPLMNVPGPNGGYPINLAYHAGVGMDQEASWTGLGWNINPGVINRIMRGVPDDFNGAVITKTNALKADYTVGLDKMVPLSNVEFMGFRSGSFSYQLYYNNYKGVGMMLGFGLNSVSQESSTEGFNHALQLSYSSTDGLGVNPSISYTKIRDLEKAHTFNLGVGYNSREGITSVNFSHEREKVLRGWSENDGRSHYSGSRDINVSRRGSGLSFTRNGYIPNVSSPQGGFNVRLGLKNGSSTALSWLPKSSSMRLSVSMLRTIRDPKEYSAFGYMYSENADDQSMMDLNREKDVPPTKDVPSLPVPVQTYDLYYVKGQGIGGAFRPHRSDVGIWHDPQAWTDIPGGELTFEYGGSGTPSWHLGSDVGINHSHSYSGTWENPHHSAGVDNYSFQRQNSVTDPLYEPFYFKSSGEQTSGSVSYDNLLGEDAARFDLKLAFSGISLKPKVLNDLRTTTSLPITVGSLASTRRLVRDKRVQSMVYRTNDMITADPGYSTRPAHIYSNATYPGSSTGTQYDYDHSSDTYFDNAKPKKQIGELSVVNPDGNRYIYGLPVYNLKQLDVAFSKETPESTTGHSVTGTYNQGSTTDENTVNNKYGSDHYFSKVETPAYAYAHLLTAIVSPDYVDLTNDGPSEDDLGYWVKFNYTPASSSSKYQWRVPYKSKEGNYFKGNVSDPDDDKLMYEYGVKDVYYLNSIETKTHIAKFILNDDSSERRKDAYGVSDEDNSSMPTTSTSNLQRYLKSVELYSKEALAASSSALPIKTAHFEYSYDLCKNVENNFNYDPSNPIMAPSNSGKLTLKKVYFTYLGNTKGQLSPYQFDYNETSTIDNPRYAKGQTDRWGTYKPDNTTNSEYNVDNPYSRQSADYDADGDMDATDISTRNSHASAWNLRKITLPSGGEINVTYETDDYAYVQDKRAMEMCRIVGTGTETGNSLTKNDLKVYFKLDTLIPSSDPNAASKLYQYVADIDKVYFKVFEKLKKKPGAASFSYDYVEGYADVKKTVSNWYGFGAADGNGDYSTAYVTVSEVPVNATGLTSTHPFRKAGWQYMRLQRPDLFVARNDGGGVWYNLSPVLQSVQVMRSMTQFLAGYYNYCWIGNYCHEFVKTGSDYRPSYIRLNTPDKIKYGGGHRVSKVTLSDKWSTMVGSVTSGTTNEQDFSYGQQFSYRMPDGTSSGVAEYEPLIGGEEIPHRMPVKYSSNNFLVNDKALYLEEPYGESYYPSANVGYRRVVVKNLDHTGVTKTASGIVVNEFYTAREFPVNADHTDIKHKKYKVGVLIPFFGMQMFNNQGYSQGYKIELNDMHGKVKSVATYAYSANINDPIQQPVSKIEYIYKTKSTYSETQANYLDNSVTVLDGDANYSTAEIGKSMDFFIDMREQSNTSWNAGLQPNVDASGLLAGFTMLPYLEWSEAMFRSVATMKVVNKNGILSEVRAYNDGAKVTTKNLMYDAETGTPLLTQVTNNFDEPVYSYGFAAHWSYPGMKGDYLNTNARITGISFTNGVSTYNNPSIVFSKGDEIAYVTYSSGNITSMSRYWVKDVTDNTGTTSDQLVIMDVSGNSTGINPSVTSGSTSDAIIILRSGRRNQQSIGSGSIISLSNPVTARTFPMFTAYNTAMTTIPAPTALPSSLTFSDCFNDATTTANLSWGSDNQTLTFTKGGSCSAQMIVPAGVISSSADLLDYRFYKMGTSVKMVRFSGTTRIDSTYAEWKDLSNCFPECLPEVLHADASCFNDSWSYNYTDAGDPQIKLVSTLVPLSSATNDYRAGRKGVWRNESNYLFQVDRKQTTTPTTDISKDGTYKNFVLYNWAASQINNPEWSLASRATLYSPYGFALENKDTLNVYSSALYGYKNSLSTAVSGASRYMETVFDGFEDYYGSSSYTAGQGHGHIKFIGTNVNTAFDPVIGNTYAHTGTKSLEVGTHSSAQYTVTIPSSYNASATYFSPIAGQDYLLSVWVKNGVAGRTADGYASVSIDNGTVTTVTTSKTDIIVDGWHKLDIKFTAPASSSTLKITLSCSDPGDVPVSFDDLRISRYKGGMVSYVYDSSTLWLLAELDNNNFATFYNYDEEGALVQVKKETIKGIITMSSSRSNVKK